MASSTVCNWFRSVFERQEAAGEDRRRAPRAGRLGREVVSADLVSGAEQLAEVVGQNLSGEVLLKGEIG